MTKRKALLGVSRFHHLNISRSVNIFLVAQAVESPLLITGLDRPPCTTHLFKHSGLVLNTP